MVCGLETLTSSETYNLTLPLVASYLGEAIPWSIVSDFILFDYGAYSSLDCRSEDLTHLFLYSSDGVLWTDTSFIELVADGSGFKINVDNS